METFKDAKNSYRNQMIMYCNPPVSRSQLEEFHKKCLEKQIKEYKLKKYRVVISDNLRQEFYELLKICCINKVKKICKEEYQFDGMYRRYCKVFDNYYKEDDWSNINNKCNKTNISNILKSIAGERALSLIVAEYENRIKEFFNQYLPVFTDSNVNSALDEIKREMVDKMRLIDDDELSIILSQEIEKIRKQYVEKNDESRTNLRNSAGAFAGGAFLAGAIASHSNKSKSGWPTALSVLAGGLLAMYGESKLNQRNHHA